MGDKLGVTFWQAVAAADRRLRQMIAPDSPAAAGRRLFGPTGLAWMIGVSGAERLVSVTSGADEPSPDGLEVTSGHVQTDQMVYPYILRWRQVNKTAAVEEILPYPGRSGTRLPHSGLWFTPGAGELASAPEPLIDLDPVAARLWTLDLPEFGIPLIARCLAAWWRVADSIDSSAHPPNVVAAAVTRLVSWRAGLRVTADMSATRHRARVEAVKAAEKALQKHLQLSATRVW